MARVTVEDCVVKVPNRFELVLLAAQRAREITSGVPLSIDRDDDKNPVVALREIADETVALPHLRESLVRGMQKHVEIDEPEETHELEVDPSVFGVAAPSALLDDEDGVDTPDFDETDDEEEIQAEGEQALDQDFAEDLGSPDEELAADVLAVDDLAVDDLAVDDEVVGDLADIPGDDLTGDDLTGADLPVDDPPGDDLAGDDLPEDELSGDDPPGDDLPEDELPEDDLPDLPEDELSGDGKEEP